MYVYLLEQHDQEFQCEMMPGNLKSMSDVFVIAID